MMDSDKERYPENNCSCNSAMTVKEDAGPDNPRLNVTAWTTPKYLGTHGVYVFHTAMRYGRKFLLKSLDARHRELPEWQRLLFKEFELGVRLDHPGIARTVAWETIPDVGEAIVMEYVDGVELSEWLRTPKGSDRKERREIIRQIVGTLDYIHSMGVSHRDLKPDNILVTHKGNYVKIIDFGLGDSDDFIVYKIAAGTKAFGAPEQLEAEPPEAAMSADIYSLGKIMAMLRPGLRYKPIIRKCLRLKESERPSAAEVMKALNRIPRSGAFAVALSIIGVLAAATWGYISVTPARKDMTSQPSHTALSDTIYIHKTDTVKVEVPSKPSDNAIQAVWDKAIKDIDPQIEFAVTYDFPDKEDHSHYAYESIPQWQDHLYYSLLGIGCSEATAQAKRKELDRYMRRRIEEYRKTRTSAPADTLTAP